MSFKPPGECGNKIVVLLLLAPISFSVSKYCVIKAQFIVSAAVTPGIAF